VLVWVQTWAAPKIWVGQLSEKCLRQVWKSLKKALKTHVFCQNFAEAPSLARVWVGYFGFWGSNPPPDPPRPCMPSRRHVKKYLIFLHMFIGFSNEGFFICVLFIWCFLMITLWKLKRLFVIFPFFGWFFMIGSPSFFWWTLNKDFTMEDALKLCRKINVL